MFFIIGGDGKEYGPVPAAQVHAWIANGRANLDTQARLENTAEWKRLGAFTEFGAPASSTPPPLAPVASVPSFYTPSFTPITATVPASTGELAEVGSRLAARAIDWGISIVSFLPGLVVLAPSLVRSISASFRGEPLETSDLSDGVIVLGALLLFLVYAALTVVQVIMLGTRGQTIGKRVMGIKIVRFLDGSNAGFINAWVLRSLLVGFITFILSFLLWFGAIFTITNGCFIFREDRRCLHDLIAGTKVVKVQKP